MNIIKSTKQSIVKSRPLSYGAVFKNGSAAAAPGLRAGHCRKSGRAWPCRGPCPYSAFFLFYVECKVEKWRWNQREGAQQSTCFRLLSLTVLLQNDEGELRHTVGVVGRADEKYQKAEGVRAQAKEVESSALHMERVLEKVRTPSHARTPGCLALQPF
eukprot:2747268-Rhodomonas_salina.5